MPNRYSVNEFDDFPLIHSRPFGSELDLAGRKLDCIQFLAAEMTDRRTLILITPIAQGIGKRQIVEMSIGGASDAIRIAIYNVFDP